MKIITRLFDGSTIAKRIRVVFIWLVLLPALLVCVYLFLSNIRQTKQANITDTQNTLHLMAHDILTRARQAEHISIILASNHRIHRILSYNGQYGEFASEINLSIKPLQKEMASYLYELGAQIMLVTPNNKIPEVYESIMHETRFKHEYYDILRSGCPSVWGDIDWHMPDGLLNQNYYSEKSISYYQRVFTGSKYLGALKCSVSPEKLFQVLFAYNGSEPLVVAKNGTILYASTENSESIPSEALALIPESAFGTVHWQGETYLSILLTGMDMYLIKQVSSVRVAELFTAMLPTLVIALLFSIVFFLMSRIIIDRILVGLKDVDQAIDYANNGKTTERFQVSGTDEIARLFTTFNHLLDVRDSQNACIAAQEVQMHAAQLLALQCQMNPHFLFNALNWLQLAIETGSVNEHTSNAIVSLSRVLHYNMSTSYLSTIGEEIDNLYAYLRFLDTREPGAILLKVDCPDILKERQFLRFTLQPLAENAVRHGKATEKTLHMFVAFSEEHETLHIQMKNDGISIDNDKLDEINGQLKNGSIKGLGLINLEKRLRLLYEDVSIGISNECGQVVVNMHVKHIKGLE